MAGETPITITGGLYKDPELEYTQRGTAKCKLSVIQKPRQFDRATNQWVDGDPSFYNVLVWGAKGEAVAAALGKGSQVIITGTQKQEHWEGRDGEKKSMWIITASEVGQVIIPQRGQGQAQQTSGGSAGGGQGQQGFPQHGNEPPF